jgi:nucleoside-diphosphate-sugar epimerase
MILVTGGAGFVGLNVVEQLLARGDEVLICDLTPPPAFFHKRALFEKADITNIDAVDVMFSKTRINSVLHLAAITAGAERDAREPRRIAEVNLIGTLNILEAARRHGVRRFVQASTGALYGKAGVGAAEPLDEERDRPVPETMYGITKYAAERACLRLGALWGMDVRVGRLATAFGPWEHATAARDKLSPPTELAKIALAGGEAVFPELGATDYIYAPDLASALIRLLDAKEPAYRLYHLGTGSAWALPEWCAFLKTRFPSFRWREATAWGECNVVPLAAGTRTRFSNRRLAEDLKWRPRFDLAASCNDFVQWLEAHRDS